MPEGDSVWRAAAELHKALAGQTLTASDFRVPRFATLNLTGWTVSEVVPRGKHLLMRLLESGEAGNDGRRTLTIHSHLKMEGSWQVYAPSGRWRKPGHTARCVLRTATADVVGFSLGILEVIPTADEDHVVGHLGPDLLGPDWDMEEAVRRIKAAPDIPIGLALLDQKNLAGIGNIYRCESCFLSGVHPAAPVSAVPDLAGLLADAKRLLEANLGSARRVTRESPLRGVRGVPRPGYWVYGREHQPCHRCGTPTHRGMLGPASGMEDRVIYYCPRCQPVP
ncbi:MULTISPECIES: Fpg/Nei family DNA glycosylase [Arthrobacter]|uniref:DNA-(apurinic or apyrimidinic site) lyase n=1 Tax=Arthrobacter terricola TaxID=2547396 RepID=A0A4R5K8E1_9MICC|nr:MULTISPECIES: DNA-formamidopyrimidine glycosylase family protein [Arthrobacter]MBT8159980.1 Fpg/Nei family DNA glycosylase [Arthrobacter sp. GN70]TDF91072.1 Fpg/Nei family DNA glycosylase [Arthrobacter terricola]